MFLNGNTRLTFESTNPTIQNEIGLRDRQKLLREHNIIAQVKSHITYFMNSS